MTKAKLISILLLLILLLTVGYFVWRQASSPATAKEEESEGAGKAVVKVKTVPLKRGDISEKRITYGSVVAEPGKSFTLSVPYESVVSRMLVVPGQSVKQGDPLVEVKQSAATLLQFHQAQNAVENARVDLKQTQQRYDLKLATNQELNQSLKALSDAELLVASFQEASAQIGVLTSPSDGIIASLGTQAGQVVPAGGLLADIVASDAIEVRIGVDSSDVGLLKTGDMVTLNSVNQPNLAQAAGKIRLTTESVNPTTRLVDVFVSLPPDNGFLFGSYVRAEFGRQKHNVFLVPVGSLISATEGFSIFTEEEGKAVLHIVSVGSRNNDVAEINGPGLNEGSQIVVEGNTELEDGTKVEATPWK